MVDLGALTSALAPLAFAAMGALGSLLLWGIYGLPRVRRGFDKARVEIPALARVEVEKGVRAMLKKVVHEPESEEFKSLGEVIKVVTAHGLDSLAVIVEEHPEVLQHPFIAKLEERMEKRVYAAWGNIVKGLKKKAGEAGLDGEGSGGLGEGLGAVKGIASAFGFDLGPLGDLLGAAGGLGGLSGNGANAQPAQGAGVVDLRGSS